MKIDGITKFTVEVDVIEFVSELLLKRLPQGARLDRIGGNYCVVWNTDPKTTYVLRKISREEYLYIEALQRVFNFLVEERKKKNEKN